MVKVVCGKSRIGEASYRGEGKGQIAVGEIELGEGSWTRTYMYSTCAWITASRTHIVYETKILDGASDKGLCTHGCCRCSKALGFYAKRLSCCC